MSIWIIVNWLITAFYMKKLTAFMLSDYFKWFTRYAQFRCIKWTMFYAFIFGKKSILDVLMIYSVHKLYQILKFERVYSFLHFIDQMALFPNLYRYICLFRIAIFILLSIYTYILYYYVISTITYILKYLSCSYSIYLVFKTI